MGLPEHQPQALAPPDRTPELKQLVRESDIRRCLAPFVFDAVESIGLFDKDGARYVVVTQPDGPLEVWDQLPAEGHAALRSGTTPSFGIGEHVFDVRPAYAGTERVGLLVVARKAASTDPRVVELCDCLTPFLGQILQSGFATWVTSEMHLASMESTYAELTQQNEELQRAVTHLRELDALKSNFLATVSHELRTPLTSVIGFSEMLLEGIAGALTPEQGECVQTILVRSEELMRLITQVLEMSQLERGAVRLDLEIVDVRSIVRGAVETLALTAKQAQVSVLDHLDDGLMVVIDGEKIRRVLLNLLANALKFSPPGAVVTIEAERAPLRRPFRDETLFGEEAADAVRVTVRDQGIGIASEQLDRIFDAFYQIDAGPTRKHGGAGLGLSIVKSLIQAHGGEVWAESELHVGTAIHFTVPTAAREG